jgi:dethiobiotin synthetase
MARKIFVTGIGTDVGKTVASAVLAEAWEADYWKPVQAGNLDTLESETVKSLLSNSFSKVYPTKVLLEIPASPHYAAEQEGRQIQLTEFIIPETKNNLIIEGAGGIMVPLNRQNVLLDWIKEQQLEVVLVSRHYLGSINHTLLSIEVLKMHNVPILGIVFNDEDITQSAAVIEELSGLPVITHIPNLSPLNAGSLSTVAATCRKLDQLYDGGAFK